MTTYWAIGSTDTGERFRVPFENKRDARTWAAEQRVVIARFFTSYTNLDRVGLSIDRDRLRLEAAE